MDRKNLSSVKSGGSVARSAGAMGAATLISRIMGLVREQVFAYLFGAGAATDAFQVAFRIPNLLRDLFAEGAMSSALVPVFTRVRAEEGSRRAWQVAGRVFRVLLSLVGVISLVGIFFAEDLVRLYASSFQTVPGKFELTVQMTRILFPFFPLVALAAAFMAILNSCGKFFLPAFASALFNVFSVAFGVFLAWLLPRLGVAGWDTPIIGMAIGVVLGGAVQAFCQLPALYREGYRYPPVERGDPPMGRDPALRQMLVLIAPGLVGLAATQVNVLVNTVLATSVAEGAVSWLNYSFRLMQFPIGIFGVSLASATLPRVSQAWVAHDRDAAFSTIEKSLRQVFAVNMAASAGLIAAGVPIIRLLFEQGQFTPEDTYATAQALAAYSVGLTAYSAVKVLVPCFYAFGKTRVAVTSSVLAVALTIGLNLLTVKTLGFWGLALGTSLAATFNFLYLMIAMRKVHSTHDFRGLFWAFGKSLAMAVAMGLGVFLLAYGMEGFLLDVTQISHRVLEVGVLVFSGGILAFVFGKLFGVRELNEAGSFFWQKLARRLPSR